MLLIYGERVSLCLRGTESLEHFVSAFPARRPPSWDCYRLALTAIPLVEDRFHRRAYGGEGVFVLCEVFAEEFGDSGRAAPCVGVRDQRFIDRDLVVLGLARGR